MFRDVTTLFAVPEAFSAMISQFQEQWQDSRIDYIAGIDARGFIIGGALAHDLDIGFVPLRKKGKLPYTTVAESYTLEYGSATIEINADACEPGRRVLLVDDLIATGGTLLAAHKLFSKIGAEVVGVAAIIDLPELGGSAKLRAEGLPVHALCAFGEAE